MRRVLAAVLVLLAAAAARADPQLDAAVGALRSDRSPKVRAQAAIVLGQIGGDVAAEALATALGQDGEPAVRLAAAGALSRIGGAKAKAALAVAARDDPDERVRESALRAGRALSPRPSTLAFSIEKTGGKAGHDSTRRAFRESIARHLRARGYEVVEGGEGYRLKPSLLRVDVEEGGGTTVIAVKASLVAVDGTGRMAAMLEGGARLKATGRLASGAVEAYAARAVDAAARTLCEDLAGSLQ
jgi:hypothetical protein